MCERKGEMRRWRGFIAKAKDVLFQSVDEPEGTQLPPPLAQVTHVHGRQSKVNPQFQV